MSIIQNEHIELHELQFAKRWNKNECFSKKLHISDWDKYNDNKLRWFAHSVQEICTAIKSDGYG